MGKIIFREDENQNTSIEQLKTSKVDYSVYNAAINDVINKLKTLRSDLEDADEQVKAYADDLVNALKAGEIKALQDAINVINGDESVEGSVDAKIAAAINGIVNGAPEAYDTMKELLDLINKEGTDLTNLITQVNDKVKAVVGEASEEWSTLEKIENTVTGLINGVNTKIEDANKAIADVDNSIPVYIYDRDLAISDENKIILSHQPAGDIVGGKVMVYTTDDAGNIYVEGEYTVRKDTDDSKGLTYIIEANNEPISSMKAAIEYFTAKGNLK